MIYFNIVFREVVINCYKIIFLLSGVSHDKAYEGESQEIPQVIQKELREYFQKLPWYMSIFIKLKLFKSKQM